MTDESAHRPVVGAVAIGRNEGERLVRCLRSLIGRVARVVYVDSGSTDGSVETARKLGAEVIELDTSVPFTAARARNAGWRRLLQVQPDTTLVQFVDGDCEVVAGWIEQGRDHLAAHETTAVVSGRRRERQPDATIYNHLVDMEWDTPIGEARACHGDAMMRIAVLQQLGGFRDDMIAGEEPELCVRIRAAGWRIMRLDAEMTRHDAAMSRFGQWWKRNVRAGHAYAEGAALHGDGPDRHGVRERRSNWVWGLVMPLIALLAAWPTGGWSLLLLLVYPAQVVRIALGRRRQGDGTGAAMLYAVFCVLGKFPQMLGQMKYHMGQWRQRPSTLIEYKGPAT
ncbi:MAG: glycosyltransferase family 2 protein [Phycisphaeraceae bacterium]